MSKKRSQTEIMNIGTSSMLVILIGLSFAVLAALAISAARSDYRMSEELAEHTTQYYDASNRAHEMLADTDALYCQRGEDGKVSFEVEVNEYQDLVVELYFDDDNREEYRITKWKVVNVDDWEGDTSLPVLKQP